ncbi:hypothetical protein AYI68_g3672 [Smittium mucronatum]|uniref:Uncharacterized protein n=1 Tax=Smittium mucronatum TaxID=133383 RepID=A0A1R0GZE3_9FUNG|nr:hypothetical protein AYI68_g3672 [Smittium mucronatum]
MTGGGSADKTGCQYGAVFIQPSVQKYHGIIKVTRWGSVQIERHHGSGKLSNTVPIKELCLPELINTQLDKIDQPIPTIHLLEPNCSGVSKGEKEGS